MGISITLRHSPWGIHSEAFTLLLRSCWIIYKTLQFIHGPLRNNQSSWANIVLFRNTHYRPWVRKPYCAPLPRTSGGGFKFSNRCLVSPKKCPQMKAWIFMSYSDIKLKNVFFQHTHSNQILINLTFFDDNEWPIIQKSHWGEHYALWLKRSLVVLVIAIISLFLTVVFKYLAIFFKDPWSVYNTCNITYSKICQKMFWS